MVAGFEIWGFRRGPVPGIWVSCCGVGTALSAVAVRNPQYMGIDTFCDSEVLKLPP